MVRSPVAVSKSSDASNLLRLLPVRPQTSHKTRTFMLRRFLAIPTIFGLLLLSPSSVLAQTATSSPPPNSLRGQLLTWGLAQTPPGAGVNPQLLATIGAVEEIIGLQVSAAPLGSSTGGFTITFDSA